MVRDTERGDSATKKWEHEFAVATPWLCAVLVLGFEAVEKSLSMALIVVASSLSLLALIMAGAALWNLTAACATETGPPASAGETAAAPGPAPESLTVNMLGSPISLARA